MRRPQAKSPPKPRRKGANAPAGSERAAAFQAVGSNFARLGSPFNQLVCELLASKPLPPGPVSRQLATATGPGNTTAEVNAVRLVNALHELALSAKAPGLAALYPTNDPKAPFESPTPDDLWQAITNALTEHKLFLLGRLQSDLRSDELLRLSLTLPALLTARHVTGKADTVLSVIHAGSGIAMLPDRFNLKDSSEVTVGAGDQTIPVSWTGKLAGDQTLHIRDRAGWDQRALDPNSRELQLQMVAVCLPEHHQQMATTRAALRLATTAKLRVDRGDSHQWLTARLAHRWVNAQHCVVDLADRNEQASTALRDLAQKNATPDAPVCWLTVERTDSAIPGGEYAVALTCWPSGDSGELAKASLPGPHIIWKGLGNTQTRAKSTKKRSKKKGQ